MVTWQAFTSNKFIRSNYRLTGNHIDYGDIQGIKAGETKQSCGAAGWYYTYISASTGDAFGLGQGFQGSVLMFCEQVIHVRASVPSYSIVHAVFTPIISGVTYIGFYAHYKPKLVSLVTSFGAETAALRYVLFVISR